MGNGVKVLANTFVKSTIFFNVSEYANTKFLKRNYAFWKTDPLCIMVNLVAPLVPANLITHQTNSNKTTHTL